MALLSDPITLPSGLTLPNRLVKAAMAEEMADKEFQPSDKSLSLYSKWASGGWGMILTGNVQVDADFRGSPHDVATSFKTTEQRAQTLKRWKQFAEASQAHGVPTVVQINHPGRQSPRIARKSVFSTNIAPSAVPLNFGTGRIPKVASSLIFGTPREMSKSDIGRVINEFIETAKLAKEAGFSGVQLHGAHGYLLSAFLSPVANVRTDEYGGSAAKRARLIVDILRGIHAALPGFSVGLKINSADHQQANGLEDSLEQIRVILEEKPDFLEISGGDYEKADMFDESSDTAAEPNAAEEKAPQAKAESTKAREAFFLQYAREVRARYPNVPLIVTGGFRSRTGMQAAITDKACDLVGIARPAALLPACPKDIILNPEVEDLQARLQLNRVKMPWFVPYMPVKSIGAGIISMHFQGELHKRAAEVASL